MCISLYTCRLEICLLLGWFLSNLLQVTYNFKMKLDKSSGDIMNSHCECPAGRGPHGTCKHLGAVALMLLYFSEGKGLWVKRSCTENLQTFHKPKHSYSGKNY